MIYSLSSNPFFSNEKHSNIPIRKLCLKNNLTDGKYFHNKVLRGHTACQCRFVILRHKICPTRDSPARLPPLWLAPSPPIPPGESLPLFSHLRRAESRGYKSALAQRPKKRRECVCECARSQKYTYIRFLRDSSSQSDFIFSRSVCRGYVHIRWLRCRSLSLRRCLLPAFREKCKTQHSYSVRLESSRAAAPATAAKKLRDRENTLWLERHTLDAKNSLGTSRVWFGGSRRRKMHGKRNGKFYLFRAPLKQYLNLFFQLVTLTKNKTASSHIF